MVDNIDVLARVLGYIIMLFGGSELGFFIAWLAFDYTLKRMQLTIELAYFILDRRKRKGAADGKV